MSVLSMLTNGATHVGVATDHVIESFRNDLWPGYKNGEGIDPALRSQFDILETALQALGVGVWAMTTPGSPGRTGSPSKSTTRGPGSARLSRRG